jgi:hypothetical protein
VLDLAGGAPSEKSIGAGKSDRGLAGAACLTGGQVCGCRGDGFAGGDAVGFGGCVGTGAACGGGTVTSDGSGCTG